MQSTNRPTSTFNGRDIEDVLRTVITDPGTPSDKEKKVKGLLKLLNESVTKFIVSFKVAANQRSEQIQCKFEELGLQVKLPYYNYRDSNYLEYVNDDLKIKLGGIQEAVEQDLVPIVTLLLQAGASPLYVRWSSEKSALDIALSKGFSHYIPLFKRFGFEFPSAVGKAVKENKSEFLRELFEAGGIFTGVEIISAMMSPDPACFNIFCKFRIGINTRIKKDYKMLTLLMHETQLGHVANVRKLCEAKADLDSFEDDLGSALTIAAAGGQNECLQVLCDAGANLEISCSKDIKLTPLHHAAYLGHVECVRILLKANAPVNIESGKIENDDLADTPLQRAINSTVYSVYNWKTKTNTENQNTLKILALLLSYQAKLQETQHLKAFIKKFKDKDIAKWPADLKADLKFCQENVTKFDEIKRKEKRSRGGNFFDRILNSPGTKTKLVSVAVKKITP